MDNQNVALTSATQARQVNHTIVRQAGKTGALAHIRSAGDDF